MSRGGILPQAWRFDPPRHLSAQMELLDRTLPAAFMAFCVAAAVTAGAYWMTLNNPAIVWWALGSVLVAGACMGLRAALPSPVLPSQALRYARAVRWMALLSGLCWGALAWWFIDPARPLSVTLVMGMMSGVSAGGLVILSASWPVSVAFGLGCLLPTVLSLAPAPGPVFQALSVASALYTTVLGVFSYHAAQATRRSIDLRFENADLVAKLRDQTARAFEARQLAEEALREAEEANRAKSVFLASASHDLRQPLHAMGLFLSTLSQTTLLPRQRQLLEHVLASSAAASEMLNTLLDFSKVDAGVIASRPESFPLQPLLHRLEQEFAPQANEKGLVFRLRETSAVLWADPALVALMLRNLIANAIRYTDRGGLLLACRRRGRRAVVEVWDTGVGIDPGQYRAIFQEFHQLGNPERDRRKGLGLGLAIVDGLARTMSVDVGVVSRVGRGSVFRVTLPLSEAVLLDEPDAEVPPGDLSGRRILLIDDDEAVRVAMAELLTAWGCWCEAVAGEAEALALLARFTPDLLVADYRLREHRTGGEAIEAVRTRLGRPLPAIIITGDTAADRLRDAAQAGVALLHKPVGSARLQRALLDALRQAQVEASSA